MNKPGVFETLRLTLLAALVGCIEEAREVECASPQTLTGGDGLETGIRECQDGTLERAVAETCVAVETGDGCDGEGDSIGCAGFADRRQVATGVVEPIARALGLFSVA